MTLDRADKADGQGSLRFSAHVPSGTFLFSPLPIPKPLIFAENTEIYFTLILTFEGKFAIINNSCKSPSLCGVESHFNFIFRGVAQLVAR